MRSADFARTLIIAGISMVAVALVGCGGTEEEQGPVDVNGTVVAGNGIVPERVQVGTLGAGSKIIEADGKFSLRNVERPFDLVVTGAPNLRNTSVFMNLTEAKGLEVFYEESRTGTYQSARLEGSVGGLGGADAGVIWFVGTGPVNWPSFQAVRLDGPSGLTGDVSWFGNDEIIGRLHSLWWTESRSGEFLGFSGYGKSREIAAYSDQVVRGVDLQVSDSIPTAPVAGRINIPERHELALTQFGTVAGQATGEFFTDFVGERFSFPVPTIDDVGVYVMAGALHETNEKCQSGIVRRLNADRATMEFNVPACPMLQGPPHGSQRVSVGTEFKWRSFPNSVYVVTFETSGDARSRIRFITNKNRLTLPNLSEFGVRWEPGREYSWTVKALSPFQGTDATVSKKFVRVMEFVLETSNPVMGLPAQFRFGNSGERTFVASAP